MYTDWCDILQRLWCGDTQEENMITEVKSRWDANNSTFILKREVLFHDIDYQTHGIFSHWCVHLSEVGLDMNLDDVREKILPLINN